MFLCFQIALYVRETSKTSETSQHIRLSKPASFASSCNHDNQTH